VYVSAWPVRGHELVLGVREGAPGVELREDGEPRVPPHPAAPEVDEVDRPLKKPTLLAIG
jgi:hypothetical protein